MAWKATRRSRFPERRFAIPAAFNNSGKEWPNRLASSSSIRSTPQGVAAQVNGSLKSAGVM